MHKAAVARILVTGASVSATFAVIVGFKADFDADKAAAEAPAAVVVAGGPVPEAGPVPEGAPLTEATGPADVASVPPEEGGAAVGIPDAVGTMPVAQEGGGGAVAPPVQSPGSGAAPVATAPPAAAPPVTAPPVTAPPVTAPPVTTVPPPAAPPVLTPTCTGSTC